MKIVKEQWATVNRILALTLVFLTFAFSGAAQTATAEGSEFAAQAALVKEFDVNGLKVLVKRRPNSPTVSAGLFIRGGTRNLTAQNAGIESFMLNAMTEGSRQFPREALRRELAKTASEIGSGSTYDYSVLRLASTKLNFDRSWEIFTDIALNPAFAPEDVELTRAKILTALANQNDTPDSQLQILEDKIIYANTSYANSPTGTAETISAIKAEDLRAYHQKSMQTSRLLLVIVGDLDAAELEKRITASFGKLTRGDYKEAPLPTLDFSKPTLDVIQRSLPTNYIQGVFDAPALTNPDFYAMRVATTILRENVYNEVRVRRNLSYAPSADMGLLAANTGNIYVTAVDANQSIAVMKGEIENLKTRLVTEQKIAAVTGGFLTDYYVGQETNAAQVTELARYELVGGGWRNSFEFLDRVKQVTPEEVQRVSQKYMKNLRFVVVGNPEAINRQIFIGQS
jgi:zinc protease